VVVAGLRYAFAEAIVEGLWMQASVLLLEKGVLTGERRLLKGEYDDRAAQGSLGVGKERRSGGETDRVRAEAARVHPRLSTTATSGVMDRKHTGGEVQR
jgi:hypothetical protein